MGQGELSIRRVLGDEECRGEALSEEGEGGEVGTGRPCQGRVREVR